MSEQVERRILFLLGNPTESPYGNPIPGLDELGLPAAESFMAGVSAATDLVAESGATAAGIIRRLGEPVQYDPELLANFRSAGVLPGVSVTLSRTVDRVLVSVVESTETLDLPLDVAVHIFVEPKL